MMKRREFILGAAFGLILAAGATAGGVIRWPEARADGRAIGVASAPVFAPPRGAPLSFADIFDRVSPAVVQIDVRARIPRRAAPGALFGPDGAEPAPETGDSDGPTAQGAGSGFFISSDGFIVTNNHVVENAQEISVRLSDGRTLKASLVGRDEETDLAVIKVEGRDFPFVAFEDGADPRVGDWVIAVGNPFGLGGTATAGIVSARGRVVDSNYVDYIQIDAAINRGNSGGPTFDVHGRVIGVNSAIISPSPAGGSVGIGFAIPASTAKPITERLMRGATVERGYLGVQIGDLGPLLEHLGLPEETRGAFIRGVTTDGPAARAGLRAGDIVLALNDRPVSSSTELTRRVGEAAAGDRLKLDITRDGRAMTVTVRSGVRPSRAELDAVSRAEPRALGEIDWPSGQVVGGLEVAALTPELRSALALPDGQQGVVVTGVAQGGDRRFQRGFVIFRAGDAPVRSVRDLEAAVASARRAGRDEVLVMVLTLAADDLALLVLPKAE